MYQNIFDVYLHDTPSRDLFTKKDRAFSSGCVRVHEPLELAAWLLNDSGMDREKIDAIVAKGKFQTVFLKKPIPVHIEYWTAWVDREGEVNFRQDIYQRDPPLNAALAAKVSKASFPLEVNGRAIDNSIDFEPVMPGEEIVFSTSETQVSRLSVSINDVQAQKSQRGFIWRAPKRPGLKTARITLSPVKRGARPETLTVQLFVMAPANAVQNRYLNGYRIGQYPAPLRDMSAYTAPAGFIQVTAANRSTRISPNFSLGQFLCKQADSYVERHQRPDLAGGVGEYRSNTAHGPFVHLDVRGTRARWGHSD